MRDLVKVGKNREEINKEFLDHLQKFCEEGWEILGWHNHLMEKINWLKIPKKLSEWNGLRIITKHLEKEILPLKERKMETQIYYLGEECDNENYQLVSSSYFCLYLAKNEKVCIVSYGSHKFHNKVFEMALGRHGFSIRFLNISKTAFLLTLLKENT